MVLLSAALVVSCASSQKAEKWENLLQSEKFQKEKEVYFSRLGKNKEFCWSIGVSDFLDSPGRVPDQNCLFPASKFIVDNINRPGTNRVLRQATETLEVIQIGEKGFLVARSNKYRKIGDGSPSVIFVHRTDEKEMVDGAYLDRENWQIYEYAGPFKYQSATGLRTIHSFTKVSNERLVFAKKGLEAYSPQKEFLIENEIWDMLDTKSP
jgi:hypothetical protein